MIHPYPNLQVMQYLPYLLVSLISWDDKYFLTCWMVELWKTTFCCGWEFALYEYSHENKHFSRMNLGKGWDYFACQGYTQVSVWITSHVFLLFLLIVVSFFAKKSCEYFHSGIVRDGIPLWKCGGWSNIIPAARVMPTFWILRDYETWKIRSWSQTFGWEDSTHFQGIDVQRKSFQTATVVDFSRGMFKGHVGMILYRWNRFYRDPVAQGFRLRGCLPAWVVILWSPITMVTVMTSLMDKTLHRFIYTPPKFNIAPEKWGLGRRSCPFGSR